VAALVIEAGGQVVQRHADVGVLVPLHGALDGQRLAEQALGFGVAALGVEVQRQAGVAGRGAAVLLAEGLAAHLQRLAQQRLGLARSALVLQGEGAGLIILGRQW